MLAPLVVATAFAFFYYKYVPLVPAFQVILAPVLTAVFLATLSATKHGVVALAFALPLVNNLPYFFGINEHIPHAPTALLLILVFGLGLAARKALFSGLPVIPGRSIPLWQPIAWLSVLVILSAIVTLFRHAGFFPFRSDGVLELVLNTNEVRAGGAIMSTVFNGLSYLAGFLFFAAVYRAADSRAFAEKLLKILAVAVFLCLVFAAVQKVYAPGLGNTPFWVKLGQINGTFKDPNSLGGFLAAFVPIALGLALSARGRNRILYFVVAALALALFPGAGSRSSLVAMASGLALFIGAAVFRAGGKGRASRYRRRAAAVVLILAVAVLGFFGSNLHKRLSWSAEALTGKLPLRHFFNYRLTLWSSALRMMTTYPLTGVGIGAYIIELPNILAGKGILHSNTDSALNYFLQVGAELGLPGLILVLWIFGRLARRMARTIRRPLRQGRADFQALGLAAGLATFLVSFLFHSYIGSFEIILFFWFLAALLFRLTDEPEDAPGAGRDPGRGADGDARGTPRGGGSGKGRRRAAIAAGMGVLVFGAVHLRNSLGPLSIEERTERFGWTQDFGFYSRERNDRGFDFRWSGARAGLAVRNLGAPLIIPVTAMHPDIADRPVTIRIYLADRRFRRTSLLLEHVQRDKEWSEMEISLPGAEGRMVHLVLEPDRTWSPQRELGVPDPRELGFAMGDPWYRHPTEVPEHRETQREIFPSGLWVGPRGNVLLENGTASMKIRIESGEAKPVAVVLHLCGKPAAGLWPYAVIRLNGSVIGRTVARREDWTPVVLYPAFEPGNHILSVEFTNDFSLPRQGEIRSLSLGDVFIIWFIIR